MYKLVRVYQPESRDQYETTRATLTVFSMSSEYLVLKAIDLNNTVAIVAFILLFATFAVGLRCFSDFDQGLQSSKVQSKSFLVVLAKKNSDTSLVNLDVPSRPKYSTAASSSNVTQYQPGYQGVPLGPRMSIE